MNDGATHVVELTPPGRAAVAVVLVAGPAAMDAVDACFAPASGRSLHDVAIGQILFGRWGGAAGEEVIACRRSVDRVEVHCHGGVAAVRAIVDRLVEAGCRRVSWQEWIRASDSDPLRAAARVALADAPTARTAAILLDQCHGALSTAIGTVLDAAAAERWSHAANMLDEVLARGDIGKHLTTPFRVVLAGPPNAGKSSLLNALAGYQRAIVSPLPGTTRDVVTLTTAIDGWPVQLADTAGLREPGDALEAAGVELAGAAIADADLLIAVQDAALASGDPVEAGTRSAGAGSRSALYVCNKVDLLAPDQLDKLRSRFANSGAATCFTCATTGDGISTLIAATGRAIVPQAPPAGAAVPFTTEQLSALTRARSAVEARNAKSLRAALQSMLAN